MQVGKTRRKIDIITYLVAGFSFLGSWVALVTIGFWVWLVLMLIALIFTGIGVFFGTQST